MTTEEMAVATADGNLLERVVIVGDLAKLAPEHRVVYYREVCRSLGLNPLTRPFQYIVLNGKLTLYATRTATDQLRELKGISIDRIDQQEMADLFVATVYGHDRNGRTDSEVGAVAIGGLKGENRANAIMKSITKAKRRLTLSLAGLGWLDETEVPTVPSAEAVDVDQETGEVRRVQPLAERVAERAAAIVAAPEPEPIEAEVIEAPPPPEPPQPTGLVICGAVPPKDHPLGMEAPCELAGAHRMHKSSEGTWPK